MSRKLQRNGADSGQGWVYILQNDEDGLGLGLEPTTASPRVPQNDPSIRDT